MAGNPAQMLQQMLGGGGMPAGTPPAMDAAMAQRSSGGDMLAQAIGQFMQNPAAMQQVMQMAGPMLAQLGAGGGDPRVAMATQQDMGPPYTQEMIPPGRTRTNYGPGPMGDGVDEGINDEEVEPLERGEAERELDEVHAKMGGEAEDASWQGKRAPTQADVDRLRTDPDAFYDSFNAQFGDGAADQYLDDNDEEDAGDDAY